MTFARAILEQCRPADVEEALLQQAVIERATELGYCVFWLPDAIQRIAAAAGRFDTMPRPGYVDLTIAGHGKLLQVECKTERGRLKPDQKRWRDALLGAGCAWRLWRPSSWHAGEIEADLTGETT